MVLETTFVAVWKGTLVVAEILVAAGVVHLVPGARHLPQFVSRSGTKTLQND